MKKIIACLLLLGSGFCIQAQNKAQLTIKIDQIISSDFPYVKAFTVVLNDKGEVVSGLAPGLFQFRVDSLEVSSKPKITPFSMQSMPIDYTIIFSNSGIMEGEPLDFQKNAILQLIETLKPEDRLSLYTIGEDASAIFEDKSKDSIDPALINGVTVTSTQPRIYDSVINVIRKVQRKQIERKIVIIISDGRDQNSRFTKDQLNAVVSEAGVPIYAIGLRVLTASSLSNLNEMSDLTGGSYTYAANAAAIPDSLRRLYARITQAYIVDIRINVIDADDMPHILEIAVDERDASGKGQKTFIAVKVPVPRWVKWAILIAAIVVIVLIILVWMLHRLRKRRRMGITRRRCPECRRRMKDSWDSCPFCKYLPEKRKKKKKRKKDA